ncbi:acetyl-CoA carboxylase carboxyltransferase component [Thermoflavifilum aggregans]|uniref:Acetyl-CoA carboxylase carboxyltransferase component n=1 Tax=Thermoflavifilum aggregans TaxID=454188 RepID=A0A2M9CVB7_9BACT|nr:acyl-CoA carboxylase subunit beta [Thermoflavifilum aggregans]PJJ75852.1 acetyl-CoA carboxylase carboxyltransferase component [Thermoflavifilum aggregans]
MESHTLQFNKNEDAYRLLLSHYRRMREQIMLGGGKKQLEKIKKQNKLSARERIQYLIDKGSTFLELGLFAGYGMYEEAGGCPAGGVVAGIGYVSGRQCVIVANDMTVKAGAWFPITAKKHLRMQEIAMQNRLPIIYLVDSAGVFLPMQDEVFPDKEHFGRVFYNNARMSAMGIPQIAAVMGSCVAGGAYLPVMSDELLMVEGNGSMFLAGPYLVKAAIGEEADTETLGGAVMHSSISGTADARFPTDEACLDHIRKLISMLGKPADAGFMHTDARPPRKNPDEIYGLLPDDPTRPYDMQEIIDRLVDDSAFVPYKPDYGKTLICGYAHIEGWAVGIVANQRMPVRTRQGEMQMGGVIYHDSADKAARFVMLCNQKKLPILFLQDVTGFMVGSRSEQAGIIKNGAKLVNAVSNSVVPKITIIAGNSFGAGNYAMCGRAYDPRFIFAWPGARIAVMGGQQAAETLLQIEVSTRKKKGENITPEEEKQLLDKIAKKYTEQMTPHYAAARLWVDEIIDPADTRRYIREALHAANQAPISQDFRTGVLQV